MTDYTKLVEALRCCCPQPEETCDGCPYDTGECNISRMMLDAADAIEALQAELGKEGKRVEHLLARVNELHAELERWVSAAEKAGEPKRGEWIDEEFGAKCSCCGKYAYWSKFGITWKSPFCPLCGAKMEVQDG